MKKMLSKRVGFVFITVILLFMAVLCIISFINRPKQYEKTAFLMDTYITQTLYGDDCENSDNVLKNLDNVFSLYKKDSEVSKLNKNAGIGPIAVSEDMKNLIGISKQYSENSFNTFDITIGTLTSLWNVNDGQKAKVPLDSEIQAALTLVNSDNIELDVQNSTVFLKESGMCLDFGGIAKGYACDKLKEAYEADEKLEAAVASFGSSILLYGQKPDGKAYKVAIRNPDDSESTIANLSLSECFVSTSGGYERYFEVDGVKYHHIFDPVTGRPSESDLKSVTVITSNGALGDFLSTAVFVGGKESIQKFDYDFSIIAVSEKNIYVSEDLKDCFEPSDSSFEVIFI